MEEVAGIVVGRAHAHRTRTRDQADRGEVLGRVTHARREALRAIAPLRVVLEQPAVLLEVRAAARGVHDERVDVERLKGFDVAARQRAGIIARAGVRVQRPAARLFPRHKDFDAVAGEHARRRGVRIGECRAHHTSGEKGDAPPTRADRGKGSRQSLR